MTCRYSARTTETCGALSATATIATIINSHHVTPQPSAPPHEPPGMKTITVTVVFTLCHHHLVSHTPHQLTSSKWSTIRRGSPPRSPSYIPHPQSTTTCHVPPFDPFWQLKRQFHPVDTHQDPLHRPFTLPLLSSATVVPFDRLDRNSAPSGVLLDWVKSSHAYLRDIFDGGCDWDSRI